MRIIQRIFLYFTFKYLINCSLIKNGCHSKIQNHLAADNKDKVEKKKFNGENKYRDHNLTTCCWRYFQNTSFYI